MKVYFDIITNHTADVIGYEEGARTAYVNKDTEPYRTAAGQEFDDRDYAGTNSFPELDPKTSFPYTPVLDDDEKDLKVPAWLNDTTLYHNRGNTTFTGEDSQYGDFFGLDDLFTENPKVVDGFIDIYRTWVKDFGVDGFRIDTMKHVDDAFWQEFGPGIVDYAKANGKPEFFMFGEVLRRRPRATPRTSPPTTKIQAMLDFPFQDAARGFASKGNGNASLRTFFESDDWYTDADSNVYELPTFLGNHDMGRIGQMIVSDNKDAGEPSGPPATGSPTSSCTSPAATRSSTTATSRASPAPRAATRTPGRRCSPARSRDYLDDDLLGTTRTHAQDNFETSHPLYQRISDLADLTAAHPALRDGAHQMRYASDGPGIVAFSRTDRKEQREYVVALNNSEQPQTASIPTYSAGMRFSERVRRGAGHRAHRQGREAHRHGAAALERGLPRRRPAGPVEARAEGHAGRSRPGPGVPRPHARPRRRRQHVVQRGHLPGALGQRPLDLDRHRRHRAVPGLPRHLDAAHRHPAAVPRGGPRQRRPHPPERRPLDPGALAEHHGEHAHRRRQVTNIDPVTVKAVVDPERAAQSVRFERRVGDGDWTVLGTDTSSPDYLVKDDVEALPLGTTVSYRAVLIEPGSPDGDQRPGRPSRPRCRSRPYSSVTVAGSLQSEMGCSPRGLEPRLRRPAT